MATRLLPNHDKKTTINIQTGSCKKKKQKKNTKMLILKKSSSILTFGKIIPMC